MSVPELSSQVSAWLKELIENNVRMDKTAGRLSLLDIITYQKKTRYASAELLRLLQKNPELGEKLVYLKFRGRRQNPTPTISVDDLPYLFKTFFYKVRLPRRPKSQPKPPLLAITAQQNPPEPQNQAPYGWRLDEVHGVLCPIHAEQQTVRYIRQLRAFGAKLSEICAQLSRDKLLTRARTPWLPEQLEEVMFFDHEALLKKYEEFWRKWRTQFRAG